MATLDDILAATKVLAEKSDNQNGASKEDDSDVKKDHANAVVTNEERVEEETIVESSLEGSRGVEKIANEKVVVENTSDQVDVDGKGSWIDNGGIGGNGGDKSDVTEGNSLSADMESNGKDQENGEKKDDLDHGFRVGDFVWGKIKSHPWWPGRIFNPVDASDFALKHRQEGRLLVAFFGDGSCSWCSPSQLKPFVENFEEMSVGSNSKSFVNAVQSALDDIGWLMESKMTCGCVPLEKSGDLAQPLVVNAGIKDGALAPDVELRRLCMPEYEPSGILTKVMHFAKTGSVDDAYALTALRGWLAAFYRSKGIYPLPAYHEPFNIEGMEDKNKTSGKDTEDFSVPIEVPILGPQEDDWASPTKSQASSGDKIYHRRKQKSVAEIMGKTSSENSKNLDKTTAREGKGARKLTSSSKKKKIIDDVQKGIEEPSTRRLSGKRKAEALESSKSATKKASNAKNRDSEDRVTRRTSSRKPKRVETDDSEDSSDDAKEELEMVTSPRERKKSKYLCPPYTTPSWRTGSSSFKLGTVPGNSSFKLGTESDKATKADDVGGHTVEASADACNPESVSKSIDKSSDERVTDGDQDQIDASVKEGTLGSKDNKEIVIPASDVDMPVDELVSDIQAAALDPSFLTNEGCLDMVWSFVSARRSAFYLHGPNYKEDKKSGTGSKRKSLKSKQVHQENGESVKSSGTKTRGSKKTDKKLDLSKSKSAVILDGNASSFTSKRGNQENDVPGKELKSAGKKRGEEKKTGKTPVSSKPKSKKTSEILGGNASSGMSKLENQENDLLGEIYKSSKKRKREEKKTDKKPDSSKSKSKSKKAIEGPDGDILSGSSKKGKQEKDRSDNTVKSAEKRKRGEKMEGKPESSMSKKVTEVLDENSSCLVLKFIPEYPLPSKEEIVKLFSKYGRLNKKETRLVTDSHTVRIVYKDDTDTKAAFKESLSENPFGDKDVVSYWLELQSPAGSKSTPRKRGSKKLKSSQTTDNLLLNVRAIREKVDAMTTTLENYQSKFSAKEISGLSAEMKNLLQNVETTGEKVRVLAENYPSA